MDTSPPFPARPTLLGFEQLSPGCCKLQMCLTYCLETPRANTAHNYYSALTHTHTHTSTDYADQALRNEIKQNGNLNLPFNILPRAR